MVHTFYSIQIEFPVNHPERQEFIENNLLNTDLMTRINQRGANEQYASILLSHYYEWIPKTKSKNTSMKNNKFVCNYSH